MVLTENHSFHFVSDYCYDLLFYFIIFNSHACEVKVQLILIRVMVLFVDYPLSLHMALFLSVACLQLCIHISSTECAIVLFFKLECSP